MRPITAAIQNEAMQRARFFLVFFFFVVLPAYPVQATRIPAWDDSMSEGCSLAPDISLACCIQHDRAYSYGGSAQERAGRYGFSRLPAGGRLARFRLGLLRGSPCRRTSSYPTLVSLGLWTTVRLGSLCRAAGGLPLAGRPLPLFP